MPPRPPPPPLSDAPLAPGLYLVSTPIGNLRDITLRALDVLAACDLVLAEDTRVAGQLLAAYGLKRPIRRHDDHAAETTATEVLAGSAAGERIALVSDAGTPLVSDPGYRLARAAIEAGHPVFPVPGALGGDGGAERRRPAHRPLPVRRLPAAQIGRAPDLPRRPGGRARHPDLLRGRVAAGRQPGRHGRRARARAPRRWRAS